jgi:hypothetical protein
MFMEKEKLATHGSKFTNWALNLRILLNASQRSYVLEAPLGAPPADDASDEEKMIFHTHAAVESYDASEKFFSCMMEEHGSISEHVLKMSGYADKLIALGITIPIELGYHRVL